MLVAISTATNKKWGTQLLRNWVTVNMTYMIYIKKRQYRHLSQLFSAMAPFGLHWKLFIIIIILS